VYKISQDGNSYSVIHTFTGTPDGQQPHCRLLQGADGMLYGTTTFGGISSQLGTIFRLNLDGSVYSVIHAFQNNTAEGKQPNAGVCQSANGALYGAVYTGGSANVGAIFRVDTDGNNYSLVRSFQTTGGDGQQPDTELVEDSDGFLYGGTYAGGSGGGTLFKIKNDGSGYTQLRSFSAIPDFNVANTLIRGADGAFYGTMEHGAGCVFTLTTSAPPPRILSLISSGNSNFVQFAGTSGVQYDVLRSSNLTSWPAATNFTAPANGSFSYADANPIKPASFYRLRQR
jgi:uncharacterized repeat protein (TIGR03803 family)